MGLITTASLGTTSYWWYRTEYSSVERLLSDNFQVLTITHPVTGECVARLMPGFAHYPTP